MSDGFIIHITPDGYPNADIRVPLGSTIPKATGGTARWNKIPRARRRDMIEFDGEDPVELKFTILLDAYPDGDVETLVERIWGWSAVNVLPFEPPVLHLEGPVPFARLPYVLDKVEATDTVERRNDGVRCRQELELSLLEYVPASLLAQGPPSPVAVAQQQAVQAPAKFDKLSAVQKAFVNSTQRTHTVAKGETLSSIAAKELGDANKWLAIGDLNNVRDPRRVTIGQVLRLP